MTPLPTYINALMFITEAGHVNVGNGLVSVRLSVPSCSYMLAALIGLSVSVPQCD